jgi:hypothetical protein
MQIKAHVAGACKLLQKKNYSSLDQLLATIRAGDTREIVGSVGNESPRVPKPAASGKSAGPAGTAVGKGPSAPAELVPHGGDNSASDDEVTPFKLSPASLFHSLDPDHAEVTT